MEKQDEVISETKNIDVQEMQQRFILEEFARKISKSTYKDSIVLKGGFVVSALLGIDERKTRDIDITYNSTIYNLNQITDIINTVLETECESFFTYQIASIREIQLDDHYTGFSCMIDAFKDNIRLHLKLDISNNTLIYPRAIENNLQSFIDEDNTINVMTYPIENILAEKFETTLDRGEFNTRIRDLLDVHYLYTYTRVLIDDETLAKAIVAISKDRNTVENLYQFEELIDELVQSRVFNDTFRRYVKNNYAYSEIELANIIETFSLIYDLVQKELYYQS